MSNSSLIDHIKISPNKNKRNHKIDTITIHCTAGQCTIESLGNLFSKTSIQSSSNYGIDLNGKIGMFVEEHQRSWCSSSRSNDNRAITIEVSSDNNTDELVEVLENLGYKSIDIKRVLPKVDRDLSIENQIKEALKLMLK